MEKIGRDYYLLERTQMSMKRQFFRVHSEQHCK